MLRWLVGLWFRGLALSRSSSGDRWKMLEIALPCGYGWGGPYKWRGRISGAAYATVSVGGEACMGAGARPEAASDITWQAIGLFVGAEWMEMAIWGCEVDRES